jgi:putative nucleotidyltransferase with HDIG domain
MRRVIALELVGLKKLDCDLYDEFGRIIYNKGTNFTPEILMKLSHSNIFKRDEEHLCIEKQQKSEFESLKTIKYEQSSEPQMTEEKSEFKSVIDQKRKDFLIKGIKEILQNVKDNTPIGIRTCILATKTILDEIYEKFYVISNIGELRVNDYYTYSHSVNVAIISAVIGKELGFNEDKLKDLTFSAFLHDIGKMKIPREILYRPGSLTPDEMNLIKEHAKAGFVSITKEMDLPAVIAQPALEHHERWGGQGYPHGLKENQISEFSQIVAIADVYDALVSEKIYRGKVPSIDAVRIMLTEEAKSFNPQIFHKFAYIAIMKTGNPSCM